MLLEKEPLPSFAICKVIKNGRKRTTYCPSGDSEQGMSPALVMVSHTWNHIQEACGHSWQRLNWAMAESVQLAIKAGLRFDLTDFNHIAENYRPGYWLDMERVYSLACERENMSACLAIESYLNRPPFIVLGHRLYVGKKVDECTAAFRSNNGRRVRKEIEAPEWLFYHGVEVGSFAGTDAVNLNSKHKPDGTWQRTPAKLWKVGRDGIKAANAAIREAKKKESGKETEEAQG